MQVPGGILSLLAVLVAYKQVTLWIQLIARGFTDALIKVHLNGDCWFDMTSNVLQRQCFPNLWKYAFLLVQLDAQDGLLEEVEEGVEVVEEAVEEEVEVMKMEEAQGQDGHLILITPHTIMIMTTIMVGVGIQIITGAGLILEILSSSFMIIMERNELPGRMKKILRLLPSKYDPNRSNLW